MGTRDDWNQLQARQAQQSTVPRQQFQLVDLYAPIAASKIGPPPLALRIAVTPSANESVGGVPQSAVRPETYVLMSALPEELRRRVEIAVQARLAGL